MRQDAMRPALRVCVAVLAFIGLAGVAPVSLAQATGSQMCPHFGPLPACHVVAIAYTVMFLNILLANIWHPAVFLVAWLPVFGLAAIGSGLELAGYDTCPKTASGWPKCYFSLALATAAVIPVIIHWKSPGRNAVS